MPMNHSCRRHIPDTAAVLITPPDAVAEIHGSRSYPDINGTVMFYRTAKGVLVAAEICGLPYSHEKCGRRIFGFHIHEGGECKSKDDDPFGKAGGHLNSKGCRHPQHMGDMPPLFGADSNAVSVFLTKSITIREILGKTVIIHALPDDFTTQPGGNSGERIACGEIRPK